MRAIDADVLKALINVHYTNLVYNIKNSMSNVSQNEDFISGVKDGYLRILSDIKNMPTIEPKRGRWIWKDHYLICSECGEENDRTNYCPNCGADMRGEDDG